MKKKKYLTPRMGVVEIGVQTLLASSVSGGHESYGTIDGSWDPVPFSGSETTKHEGFGEEGGAW